MYNLVAFLTDSYAIINVKAKFWKFGKWFYMVCLKKVSCISALLTCVVIPLKNCSSPRLKFISQTRPIPINACSTFPSWGFFSTAMIRKKFIPTRPGTELGIMVTTGIGFTTSFTNVCLRWVSMRPTVSRAISGIFARINGFKEFPTNNAGVSRSSFQIHSTTSTMSYIIDEVYVELILQRIESMTNLKRSKV